ncbi:MAG: hypothetical protein Q8O67_13645 [Deltaproteobacteria bacterium]|nr:hypothetical protein [Deltaproteobacteria bacterium]
MSRTPPNLVALLFPLEPQPTRPRFGPSLLEMMQVERMVDAVCAEDARLFPLAAEALRAVAEHARAVEPYWRDIAAVRGIDPTRSTPPRVFERDTLVLLRQGLVIVEDLRGVANAEGDTGLCSFCGSWLHCRRPLVDAVGTLLGPLVPTHPKRAPGLRPNSLSLN